jgi:hypothetical protein
LHSKRVASAVGVPADAVSAPILVPMLGLIKISLLAPWPSGHFRSRDVYGSQQAAALYNLELAVSQEPVLSSQPLE